MLLAGAAPIALALGCAEPDAAVRREMTDSGRLVVNTVPGASLPEGRLRSLWSYASSEWGDPHDVELSGKGRLAVVDGPAVRVHRLSSTGEVLESIGEEGEGPGEWPGVGGAVFQGNRLWVRPARLSHLEVYDSAARLLEEVQVQEPLRLLFGNDSLLVGRSRATVSSFQVRAIGGADPPRQVAAPEPSERYPAEEYGPCWMEAASASRIVRSACSAGRLQVLDLTGAHVLWIELADEPRPATEQELDDYVERFWQQESGGRAMNPLIERQLEGVRERAAVLPRYSLLRTDPVSDRIFLLEQPFGDHGDRPGILHVISPEGEHQRRIALGRRVRDFAVHADTIAMLVRHPETDEVGLVVSLLELADPS